MRRGWIGSVSLLLVVAGASMGSAAAGKVLPPEGESVIGFLTKTVDYRSWPLWPGKGSLYQGQHPHGAFLTTYVTPEAAKAISARAGRLPDGAMVVKENYSADKQLAAITVMYRIKGYNPEGGDWFYLKYAPTEASTRKARSPAASAVMLR